MDICYYKKEESVMEENRNMNDVVAEKTVDTGKKIDIIRILKDAGFMALGSVVTIVAAALLGDKGEKKDGNV